ncbi:glycosyl transferase family 2 [Lactiplantibacillus plantarum EGD-AQ4]|nr:glycosyl transferase family 2 [Lactiplantibacillus plantarum EGD-AQ4]
MKYASVIVTFNRVKLLKKAIESVLQQTVKPEYIIILDNHSTDGTRDLMKQYKDDGKIIYIRTKENVGGSMGFYLGLAKAYLLGVDWISLSDDDAIFENHYFEKLIKKGQKHPEIQCFTGTVRSADNSLQLIHRRMLLSNSTLKEVPIAATQYDHDFCVDGFTFVGVFLSRDLISKVGMPEKDYFIWNDDAEYALRVRKVTPILNVSDATVYHLNNTKVTEKRFQPSWKEYYGIRNRIQMENKHSTNRIMLIPSNLLFITRRIIGMTVKNDHRRYFSYLFKQLVDGYADGIRGVTGKNEHYLP